MKPELIQFVCRSFVIPFFLMSILLFARPVSAQTIVYVDADATGSNNGTSWPNAYTDLQDALAFAGSNSVDEIWVAEGTYTPTTGSCSPGLGNCQRDVSFELVGGVEMYGGFDATETVRDDRDFVNNITILSGDRLGDDGASFSNRSDNSYQVITASNLNSLTIVDGFTIKGGDSGPGAGAYITGTTLSTLGPAFRNCIFTDNRAANGGAVAGDDITLNMRECTITQNLATQFGGGIYTEAAILRNCIITDNSADAGGGAYILTSESVLLNCTISDNEATDGDGGGIYADDDQVDLISCLVSGNIASGNGGGLYTETTDGVRLTNCVFYANTANGGGTDDGGGGMEKGRLSNCQLHFCR